MIKHHPSDETLFRYANGTLEAGPRLVVSVHVGGCPACAERVAEFEAVGGSLLETTEPAPMNDAALDRLMAKIDAGDGDDNSHSSPLALGLPLQGHADLGIRLPEALDACGVGPWRWIGPGVRWSRVTVPGDEAANVMLLKVTAGRKLPDHTHAGLEYTQILKGSFSDARGRYDPGDMDEADDSVEHQPIVDQGGECICLAAIEGHMRLRGFFGRMLQPLIRG